MHSSTFQKAIFQDEIASQDALLQWMVGASLRGPEKKRENKLQLKKEEWFTGWCAIAWRKAKLPSFTGNTSVGGPREGFAFTQRSGDDIRWFHVISSNHQMVTTSFQVESRSNGDVNVCKQSDGTGLGVSMDRRVVVWAHAISLSVTIACHREQWASKLISSLIQSTIWDPGKNGRKILTSHGGFIGWSKIGQMQPKKTPL